MDRKRPAPQDHTLDADSKRPKFKSEFKIESWEHEVDLSCMLRLDGKGLGRSQPLLVLAVEFPYILEGNKSLTDEPMCVGYVVKGVLCNLYLLESLEL